ncbi:MULTISPECIES: FAD-binding oxidoreductase [Mycolicibacterium]|uniref:FAD/FMN-dependent dehydrogenase n=1 Tax=Mycolicibacterium senegalense TaxID=1796 RepID=A0A378SY26_9MYCO|nr:MULTISPECIES: FAD-binding oxidoreductase [Mycolicibacterium]MCV7336818.1 FAD-binding oxidoreductase [Mycolicibacterium senegalense]MDR7291708.1 FAD/FMN-containing dehydrogenase [Mycolicibacterium senegalense]QZA23165.1 FAD-binding oxidoreductase [Mycolicibacterium senegalense]CDP89901.1 FAD linked oxidase domain-containing protein [Mycolicibacterium farcinogenes]STZ53290.1 FAD/FMN-dependent dehydrogenase [Mycolicibacterium senegalense]
MTETLTETLAGIVGAGYVTTDPDVLDGRCVDHTGRYRGRATALVRPGTADEVAAVLRACRDAGACVTVQGGRTSLVAGTVPENDDILLSTERLTQVGAVDTVERRISVGAGTPLAAVQRAATAAGLVFGVDLAARESATVGGMASTNAGGLRTVRYGNMGEQVLGLDIALPDGSVVHRHSRVRRDNTGYDLAALFVGAEGTLGVITALDLRLHPTPTHRITAICGFADLDALVGAGRIFRDLDGIAALELIDARASALTAEHLGVAAPVEGAWQLLIELAADSDQTERLADALEGAELCGEPAVGVDTGAQQRLWQVRESVAEVLGLFGPPLKFDVSLPLSAIRGFSDAAAELIAGHAPEAIPVLFGHLGEGNLHLNVLRCSTDAEAELYTAMMGLVAAHGGNVSSEHGVGSRKRDYVAMSRTEADIAAMRAVKAAFDPDGYLNRAVLFHRSRP